MTTEVSEAAAQGTAKAAGLPGKVAGAVLGLAAVAVLFAMMALTFADVWGRYVFRRPVPGAYEITEMMMGVLIFAALPLLCAREGHVTIDILDGVTPKRVVRPQRFVINLVCGVVLAVLAWRMFELAGTLGKEVTMTLKIPHQPFAYAFAALSLLASAACFVNCWGYLTGTRQAAATPS